jgi:hypothetical protein
LSNIDAAKANAYGVFTVPEHGLARRLPFGYREMARNQVILPDE